MKKVVLLTTPTCVKCKAIKEELKEYDGNVPIEVANACDNDWTDFIKDHKIVSVPTAVLFNDDIVEKIEPNVRTLRDVTNII